MNRLIFFLCLFALAWFSLQAQNERLRVAVFDPTSSGTGIDEGIRMAVREIISSTFVNTGKYTIVERSLIEKVMQEQQFSNSGAVDDSQASEIGRLAGANKVVLSVITLAGGPYMLSIKLVDVNTANVEKQKTSVIKTDELLLVVEPMTLEMMGEEVTGNRQTQIEENPEKQQSERIIFDTITPSTTNPTITSDSKSGYITYTVKSGDTLYRIARRLGVTVKSIQEENGLNIMTNLRIGQVLMIRQQ